MGYSDKVWMVQCREAITTIFFEHPLCRKVGITKLVITTLLAQFPLRNIATTQFFPLECKNYRWHQLKEKLENLFKHTVSLEYNNIFTTYKITVWSIFLFFFFRFFIYLFILSLGFGFVEKYIFHSKTIYLGRSFKGFFFLSNAFIRKS